MHGMLKGINTAVLKHQDKFMALMLKLRNDKDLTSVYYLQAPVLEDLLLCLRNRLKIVEQRLSNEKENYGPRLKAANEALLTHTPEISLSELEHPEFERRITSITFTPGQESSTIIVILQNGEVTPWVLEDIHVEALLFALHQALVHANEQQLLQRFAMNIDYIMLYAVDLTNVEKLDYQHQQHEIWKLNLFMHHLAVLFCYETEHGKNILAGMVLKTNTAPSSPEEKNIVILASDKTPRLKALKEKNQLCQIVSRIIPSEPGKVLSLEECLRPLHAFFIEQQNEKNNNSGAE